MANTIGAVSFLKFDRQPPTAGEQVALESQAGKDGHAAWKTGSRGKTFSLVAMRDVDTFANAIALVATLEAMRSTIVAITFDGNALGNFLVHDVNGTATKTLHGQGGIVGGASTAIIEATFQLTPWS